MGPRDLKQEHGPLIISKERRQNTWEDSCWQVRDVVETCKSSVIIPCFLSDLRRKSARTMGKYWDYAKYI